MNYVGNKGGQVIFPQLINNIPRSRRYFSLFFGAGGLEKHEVFSKTKWICSEKNTDNLKYSTPTAAVVYNDYKVLVEQNNFTSDDFIFADPPYMFSTRAAARIYYKYEFTNDQHVEFLNYMISLNAKVMITHPINELYSSMLEPWYKVPFEYHGHKGLFKDSMWLNYNPCDIELINYEFLGVNSTDRQRIKRKRANIIEKLRALPKHELKAILLELNK